MPGFEFPKIHSFPPLYTRQPNAAVLQKQLDSWCEIWLAYCQHYRVTLVTLQGQAMHSQLPEVDVLSLPAVFENRSIDRTALAELRGAVVKHLVHKLRQGEYIDPKKPELGLVVYWRLLLEWSNLLYEHVDSSGQLGTVLTVYELTQLEELAKEELRNLDAELLEKILRNVLIKQGKAQILMNEDGKLVGGIKFV